MNDEWRSVATSIAEYMREKKQEKRDLTPVQMYNEWSHRSMITIHDDSLSEWALHFLADLDSMDEAELKEL